MAATTAGHGPRQPSKPAEGEPVRLIAERRFDPPRRVEVLHARWPLVPGFERAWRLCTDDRGWVAAAAEIVGLTKGGFQTVMTREFSRGT